MPRGTLAYFSQLGLMRDLCRDYNISFVELMEEYQRCMQRFSRIYSHMGRTGQQFRAERATWFSFFPDITFQGFDPERILPVSLNNRVNEYFEFYDLLDERAPYTETVPSAASADSSVIVMEVKNVQSWTPPTPYTGRCIYNQRNIQAVDRWRHNISSDYSKTSPESELPNPCPLPTPILTPAARGGRKRPAQLCDDEMCDMHHGFNAAKRIKLQALDGPGVAAVDNERDGRGIYGKGQPGVQEWNRLGRDWEHARGYY